MAKLGRDALSFSMPAGMNRMVAGPLDMSSVYYKESDMITYATTSAIAYVGQVLTLVHCDINEETGEISNITGVTAYTIQDEAGNLEEIGMSSIGDNSTIEVADDGTISLKGVSGLVFSEEVTDEETQETTTVTHKYQPLLVDGILTWIEPSATTVEGLASEIEGIKSQITTIDSQIEEINDIITTFATKSELADASDSIHESIEQNVTTLQNNINKVKTDLVGTDDDTKDSDTIKGAKVYAADLVASAGHLKRAVVETLPTGGEDDPIDADTIYMIKDSEVTDGDAYIEYMLIDDELVPIGSTQVNLEPYAKVTDVETLEERVNDNESAILDINNTLESKAETSVVNSLTEIVNAHTEDITSINDALDDKADSSDVATLLEKVTNLESVDSEKNVIQTVDTNQFNIDENRNLTLLDIAMGKVTGLTDALAGKANKGTTLAEYGITDAYTKTETETRLQEVLDGLSDTSETAASVAQALETYKTSNDQRVDNIEGKLESVAEGAQVNVLEAIKINGVAQNIADKTVDIPIATDTRLGVVMSNEGENKVTVAADGSMEVNSLNVSKLVQTEGTVLVLDGGTSSTIFA